ncbi:hypothetical protein I204_06041 [Kwoniella mangroviensis CBS 8886]|nr:hypothetical protein I204_06041 [Kwoniella mangroviensis CBS 8886]
MLITNSLGVLCCIWAGPIQVILATPIDPLQGQDKQSKEIIAGPLWSIGGPVVTDVLQGPEGECWFQATLAALVKCHPAAITNIVEDSGIGNGEEGKVTDEANVKLLNNDNERKTFQVDHQTSVVGIADGLTNWWPAAIKRGVMKMGGYPGIKENTLEGGKPEFALRFLTGKEVDVIVEPTIDETWSWIKHSDSSPMVIGTKGDTNKLDSEHGYAVMSYDGDGPDDARARLRDPNNGVEWYDLRDIADDIQHIAGLAGFASVP